MKPVSPIVDDADVETFVKGFMEQGFTSEDSEVAYLFALRAQQQERMTLRYSEEFARKVRQKVQWCRA